jgi:diguanylate cyclase (GGDEF)-like protein
MLFEYHAMKLVTSALQMEDTSIPSEIADYPLSSEEEAASSTAKMQTAVEIVFGDSYQAKKDTIDSYIEQFTDSILEQLLNENQINSQKTKTLLIRELISVIFMILISIAIYWIWYTQVIVILEKYIKCIVLNRPLEQHGAYEFRYLAESYNFVSQKINEENIKLHHSAEHDALTGLINRSTLEYNIKKALSGLTPAPSYGAFLLVDVDGFKSINDSYGHGCGDRMLQTVAHLLKSTFRTTDLVARFGGDEFAVWLYGIKEEHTFVIVNYIQKINDALQHPANDLPKESLSVGAIFVKKDEDFNSFYKKADLALYQVKEHGKCNILFYDQSMGE